MKIEVSVGEALDKLSILDIKCRKIVDPERREFCVSEYEMLHCELRDIVERFAYEYRVLTWVNESIWNLQDTVREQGKTGGLLERILDENDLRFRVKDRVNKLAASTFREQKGYGKRRALLLGHLGLGDLLTLNGAIRYFAFLYDEVVVVCKQSNLENAMSFFSDMPSVKFHAVQQDSDISPNLGGIQEFQKVASAYHRVILSGCHLGQCSPWDQTGDCFYKDMGIPVEVRTVFFHVPETERARSLFASIPCPFRFVHQKSSSGDLKLVTWDPNEHLTLDPNQNLYPNDHPWHSVAESFVGHPLIAYVTAIAHAEEVHLINSSFACLTRAIPLRARIARCYLRETGEWEQSFTFTFLHETQ